MVETDKKVQAFWKFLLDSGEVKGIEFDDWFEDLEEEVEDESYEDRGVTGTTYLILTDEEADSRHFDSCQEIVDECYMPEVNKILHDKENRNWALAECFSFDYEKCAKIVKDNDGRGNTLASYDGEENEVFIDGEWFYLYRVN
jgi:hypothetical protein